MLWNLLTSASEIISDSAANSSSAAGGGAGWQQWIMPIIMFAIIIVFMVINRRSQKKRQEETKNMLDAIQPGNKVKTIGGICGVVVEVCEEDNTFILETGSEKSGKAYIKFDKQAVYQTDAVASKPEQKKSAKEDKQEEPAEEEKTEKAE